MSSKKPLMPMTSDFEALLACLEKAFVHNCVEKNRTIYSESGRTFALQTKPGDQVAFLNLNTIYKAGLLDRGEKIAEGVFVCRPEDRSDLILVILELKGSYTRKAIKQINQTFDRLCSGRWRYPVHSKAMKDLGLVGHGEKAVGVIASRQALPRKQLEMARARQKGLILIHQKSPVLPLSRISAKVK